MTHRILIVDDDLHIREVIRVALRKAGMTVFEARDGKEALTRFAGDRPDLIILDIGMPEVDGHQVARLLRSEFGAELRIVAITAYARDEDRQRTRKAGFDAHVTKPVDIPILESILSTLKGSSSARA